MNDIVDVIKHSTLKISTDVSELRKAINSRGDQTCRESDLFAVDQMDGKKYASK